MKHLVLFLMLSGVLNAGAFVCKDSNGNGFYVGEVVTFIWGFKDVAKGSTGLVSKIDTSALCIIVAFDDNTTVTLNYALAPVFMEKAP